MKFADLSKCLTRSYLCVWCWWSSKPCLQAGNAHLLTAQSHSEALWSQPEVHPTECRTFAAPGRLSAGLELALLCLCGWRWDGASVRSSSACTRCCSACRGVPTTSSGLRVAQPHSLFIFLFLRSWCLCCASEVCVVFCFVLVSAGMELVSSECRVWCYGLVLGEKR